MPNLPQQPILPAVPSATLHVVTAWAAGLNAALIRLLTQLTYVVNGLCKSGTLSERTDEPPLNETFFVTSDSKEVYAAVDGEWVQVGPRRGSVSVAAGNTTASATLSPEASTTGYRVILTPNWATTVYATDKAVGSFTCNTGTAAPGGGGTVDYMLLED